MPKSRDMEILPPLAGLNKKQGYQSQPPYTTPDCVNVRPVDTGGRRNRIGSRPGIGKAYQEELGSGNPIRLLSKVSFVGAGEGAWSDKFNGASLNTVWSESTPFSTDGIPTFDATGWGSVRAASDEQRAMDRDAFTVDATNAYYVEAQINDNVTGYTDTTLTYRIFARMADGSPDVSTNGLEVRLNIINASDVITYSGGLYVDGVLDTAFAGGSYTVSLNSPWFTVKIDGNDITATVGSVTCISAQTISAHTSQTRVGLGLEVTGTHAFGARAHEFRIRTEEAGLSRRTYVVASSNGQVYYDESGVMTAVGASDAVDTNHPLMAAELRQKLYIANYSTTDAAQAPVIYDPIAGTVAAWTATDGTLPTRCKLICRYRDRIVLAGDILNPHLWYMSRLRDPLDWDYGKLAAEDTASAVSAANSDAGSIGEEITALIPFADDYLIFGCSDSIWSLRGDPAYGGQLDALSRNIGIVSGFAHCTTPDSELIFLSKDGLYLLPPGAGQHPIPISSQLLPDEMLNIDPQAIQVTMAYDVEHRGIHIGLTAINAGQTTHYFFDWDKKGFWPVQWPYAHEPFALYAVATPTVDGVLMGCRDGYIRRHDNTYTSDDGTEPTTYCVYGPIRPGGSAHREGVMKQLNCTLNPNQNGTAWTVNTAETPQGALLSPTAQVTGTFSAVTGHGRNYTQISRVRGGAVAVKIASGTDGLPWSVEELQLTMMPTGKHRRI